MWAIYANKRNLTILSDAVALTSLAVPTDTERDLLAGIPHTVAVTPANADAMWAERCQFFFKPETGYGSKAAYRGDKLTQRVWGDILAADYDLQKAKNDVILNVVTLYTNVIFNQELFENAKYQLNSSQQQLDRIKKQVEAGALSTSNQLNQEAQVATNELNAINQENVLNLSLLQLKQSMQMPASESVQVEIPDLQLEDLILDKNAEAIYQSAIVAVEHHGNIVTTAVA